MKTPADNLRMYYQLFTATTFLEVANVIEITGACKKSRFFPSPLGNLTQKTLIKTSQNRLTFSTIKVHLCGQNVKDRTLGLFN